MMLRIHNAALILGLGLLLVNGCTKKTTTVDVTPPEPAAPAEQVGREEASAFSLSDEASFDALEMDDEMKEVFQTVYFNFDKYDLIPQTVERLQIVGQYLQQHPRVRILMEGHCDEPGSAEYNIGLGWNRAGTVKEYLVAYGVPENRFETTSYGKERFAFTDCATPECHAKNRRVEFKLLAK